MAGFTIPANDQATQDQTTDDVTPKEPAAS
jgi:hypothetical protein